MPKVLVLDENGMPNDMSRVTRQQAGMNDASGWDYTKFDNIGKGIAETPSHVPLTSPGPGRPPTVKKIDKHAIPYEMDEGVI